MNRDASARLTISSPLEAHKSHMLTFDIIGVDVGLENPIFACLELDYSNVDSDSTGETAEEVAKVRRTPLVSAHCLAASAHRPLPAPARG